MTEVLFARLDEVIPALMAANSIRGNNTAGTANGLDLTVSQVAAMLAKPVFTVTAVVDFNQANTDFTLPIPQHITSYWVFAAYLRNSGTTASLTTARGGMFTATGGGGIVISADAALAAITSNANDVATNGLRPSIGGSANLTRAGTPNLYWRTSTAQGAAATGTITAIIIPIL